MRAVMVTGARTKDALEQDWIAWKRRHGADPDLIVGDRDLAFVVDTFGPDEDQSIFRGVRVLDLVEFEEINDHLKVTRRKR